MREPTDVEARLRWQRDWCERLGSPLYAALLDRAANDFVDGGPTRALLEDHDAAPAGSALALRFLGAIHRLALMGEAPAVAQFYPSCGGAADVELAWEAVKELIVMRKEDISHLVTRPVQTNEVGRSAALLGGFLLVARETELPLRILEIGASAGLNLRWDHYRYEAAAWEWGSQSPVTLPNFLIPPPFEDPVEVVERLGCDVDPVDPISEEGQLTLKSYVWADQPRRLQLLEAALETARRVPVEVQRRNAGEWVSEQVSTCGSGVATVLFHSVVSQYLSGQEQLEIESLLAEAAGRATAAAPFAWLSFEPGQDRFEVRLRLWPNGVDEVLAHALPHGDEVRWVAGGSFPPSS